MAEKEFTTYAHPWKANTFQRVPKGGKAPEGWQKVNEPTPAAAPATTGKSK